MEIQVIGPDHYLADVKRVQPAHQDYYLNRD